MENTLEIRGLSFETGARRILQDLSLSVAAGEVHALLGANGTGKSTLSYLIMGTQGYKPCSGDILLDGRDITPLELHERAALGVTLAWQEPVRFEGIRVADYLSLGRMTPRASVTLDPSRCLALAGLDPGQYMNRMVDRCLSGGERKRIELASVLALSPRLAVLDEPDSGIDMLSMDRVRRVIEAFKESGSAVLLITHRIEVALMADTASLLCLGRIVCSGTPAGVAEFYKTNQCTSCTRAECAHV